MSKKLSFFLILLITICGCGSESELDKKFDELEDLYKELSSHYKKLHKELKSYALYEKNNSGFFGSKEYSFVELKLNGINSYKRVEGKLFEEYEDLNKLKNYFINTSFEQAILDNEVKSQLIVCHNYQTKHDILARVLLNLHNALKDIKSEIDFVNTDKKLKTMKESEVLNRIDDLFQRYDKSDFQFNDSDLEPSDNELKKYW